MPVPADVSTVATSQSDYVERLSCLREVERQLDPASKPASTRYVQWKNYLITPSHLFRAIPRSLVRQHINPILKFRNVGRFIQQWSASRLATVESSACLIEARPHWRDSGFIRSYYASSGTTIKIAVNSQSGKSRIRREIRARQVVEQIGEIPVPKMYGQWETEEFYALSEPWIIGHPCRRQNVSLLVEMLLPRMERHNRCYGVREMTLAESGMGSLAERVAAAAELFEWSGEWIDKRQFLKTIQNLEASHLTLPGCFGHGDLSLGHILISKDGSPIVIDWDGGGEQPIARDLADLCRSVRPFNEQLVNASLAILRRFCTPSTYSAEAQLLIFSLRWATLYRYFQTAYAEQGRAENVTPTMIRVFNFAQRLMREHECRLSQKVCGHPVRSKVASEARRIA